MSIKLGIYYFFCVKYKQWFLKKLMYLKEYVNISFM